MPPGFYIDNGRRRIVFQVWDWQDERRYVVHVHVARDSDQGWIAHHFVGCYRAVTADEIAQLAEHAGFRDIRILPPSSTGFYQPIIVGNAP